MILQDIDSKPNSDWFGICPRYNHDMPKICPRYAQDMPTYAQDMPKIGPRYAQDMLGWEGGIIHLGLLQQLEHCVAMLKTA